MSHSFPCALCRSRTCRPLFFIKSFRFWRCADCGLIQMNPFPETEGVGEDYEGFDLGKYREFMAAFRVPQYERDLSFIRTRAGGGRLLDVGCGTGEFLEVARGRGFESFGVEPSLKASEIAGQAHNVVRGELQDVSFKAGDFDVVTLWSVLEHVPAPSDFLSRIHSILKRGGILALRVPDARGLLPALALGVYRLSLGRIRTPLRVLYQLDWHYKHFYGYDLKTLKRLLGMNGFEVLEARSENSFDRGSLDLRMEYIPVKGLARSLAKGILGAILLFSNTLKKEDEIVLLARKI